MPVRDYLDWVSLWTCLWGIVLIKLTDMGKPILTAEHYQEDRELIKNSHCSWLPNCGCNVTRSLKLPHPGLPHHVRWFPLTMSQNKLFLPPLLVSDVGHSKNDSISYPNWSTSKDPAHRACEVINTYYFKFILDWLTKNRRSNKYNLS